jgi:hypothetical protein
LGDNHAAPKENENRKQCVLCKRDPQYNVVVFVGGGDPRTPTFDRDVTRAAKFESVDDALLCRSLMPHQLGGTEKYRVHELLPDGQIIDVEGQAEVDKRRYDLF